MENKTEVYLNKHADISKAFLTGLTTAGFYFSVKLKKQLGLSDSLSFWHDPSAMFAIALTLLIFLYVIDYLNALYAFHKGATSDWGQFLAILFGLTTIISIIWGAWSIVLLMR